VLPSAQLCCPALCAARCWRPQCLAKFVLGLSGACLPGTRHALSLLIVLPLYGIGSSPSTTLLPLAATHVAPCACSITAAVTIGHTTGSVCLHNNNSGGGQIVPVRVTAPMKVPNQVEARCTESATSGCAMYAATLVHTAAPPTYKQAHPAVYAEEARCAGSTCSGCGVCAAALVHAAAPPTCKAACEGSSSSLAAYDRDTMLT